MILRIIFGILIFPLYLLADYSRPHRVDQLVASLGAFQKVRPSELDNLNEFVQLVYRNRCKAPSEMLTLNCLQEEVKRNCAGKAGEQCQNLSDILMVNQINEKQFISELERIRLASKASGTQFDFKKALLRKHALLTTEFLLSAKHDCDERDSRCLAQNMDTFCLASADSKSLSWQACASAIIWFIGTAK